MVSYLKAAHFGHGRKWTHFTTRIHLHTILQVNLGYASVPLTFVLTVLQLCQTLLT